MHDFLRRLRDLYIYTPRCCTGVNNQAILRPFIVLLNIDTFKLCPVQFVTTLIKIHHHFMHLKGFSDKYIL
jgi:hypothetical protein